MFHYSIGFFSFFFFLIPFFLLEVSVFTFRNTVVLDLKTVFY